MAENQVATTNQAGNDYGQVAITSTEMARSMMFKYAEKLLSKDRAQEFFTNLGYLMRSNPKIAKCSPESIFNACMQAVNLDLMPNTPEHFCSLIPYGSELQFQMEYKGLQELAFRGGVKTIKADLVFAEDYFMVDDAMNTISHRKDLTIDRTRASDIIAAYAVAKLENGEIVFEVMSPSEIKRIKDKSVKAKGAGTPWSEWEDRMIRKTVIKRLSAVLPNSSKDNRLKAAVEWDNQTEGGKHMKVDLDSGNIIQGEEVSKSTVPQGAIDDINEATSAEELEEIMGLLTVPQQKEVAPLVEARLKALKTVKK